MLQTDAIAQIKAGVLSPLREDDGHYYAVAVMKKGEDRLKLATVAWPKEPLGSWLAKAETQAPVTMAAVTANYTLPTISGQPDNLSPSVACSDDTWTATSTTSAPDGRYDHTAVWTGSEMIVWGGHNGGEFEHRRQIQSEHRQLDSHQHHQCARRPRAVTPQCGLAAK